MINAVTFTCQFSITISSQSVYSVHSELTTNRQFFIIIIAHLTFLHKENSTLILLFFFFFAMVFELVEKPLSLVYFWMSAFSETWLTEDRITFEECEILSPQPHNVKVNRKDREKCLVSIMNSKRQIITNSEFSLSYYRSLHFAI